MLLVGHKYSSWETVEEDRNWSGRYTNVVSGRNTNILSRTQIYSQWETDEEDRNLSGNTQI